MTPCFFDKIDAEARALLCVHVIRDPRKLVLVYHSEEGAISACREADHETGVKDWRWAHAGHIVERHPQVKTLSDVPPNHVSMFFPEHDHYWALDTLLDEENH